MVLGLAIGSLIAGSGIVILLSGIRLIEIPVEVPSEEIPVEVIIEPEVQITIPDPGEILITQVGF